MLKTKKKNKAGFSFIELMTVMAIVGIMAAIAIVSLRGSKAANDLETSRREVASAIKLAQSYALQGKTIGGNAPCGFGFRFTDNNTYEIFYIVPGGSTCSVKNASPSSRTYSDSDYSSLERYDLRSNVTADFSGKDIYFTIPHGNAYNSSGNPFPGGNPFITFTAGSSGTKTLAVNPFGLITE